MPSDRRWAELWHAGGNLCIECFDRATANLADAITASSKAGRPLTEIIRLYVGHPADVGAAGEALEDASLTRQ